MTKKALTLGLLAGVLTTSASALAQDIEGFDDGGNVIRPYQHKGTQLLRSFFFNFNSDDHHIQAVGIAPDSPGAGQIRLNYQDQNSDDDYYYHIQHYDVAPSTGIQSFAYGPDFCVSWCNRTIPRPAGDYVFVLRGFYVAYQGTDHHLDQFGIRESDGVLTVLFNDQDNNDGFQWEVQYAYVPRSRFSSLGEASGTASGQQGQTIPWGTSVIRGFEFDYGSGDHHVDEIGVFQWGNGTVQAYFNDQNDDDSFKWLVRWGVMN